MKCRTGLEGRGPDGRSGWTQLQIAQREVQLGENRLDGVSGTVEGEDILGVQLEGVRGTWRADG
jgi:hypothetical protein